MSILSLTLPASLTADKSVRVLNDITGVVFDFLHPSPDNVGANTFALLLRHFNEALLGFSLIIFAVMLFVGTMNTAADGQFLGRNWNGVWTPIRLILGILFVVPLKTGLCVGQYIFLYVILLGVAIGTSVWDKIVGNIFEDYSPPAIPTYVSDYAVSLVEKQLLYASIVPVVHKMLIPPKDIRNCPLNPANPGDFFQLWVTNQFYKKAIDAYNTEYRDAIGRENILKEVLPKLTVNPADIPAPIEFSDTESTPSYSQVAATYKAQTGESLSAAGPVGMYITQFGNAELVHSSTNVDPGDDTPTPTKDYKLTVDDFRVLSLEAHYSFYNMAQKIYIQENNPPYHIDTDSNLCKNEGICRRVYEMPALTKLVIAKKGLNDITFSVESADGKTMTEQMPETLGVYSDAGKYWSSQVSGAPFYSLSSNMKTLFTTKTNMNLVNQSQWTMSVTLSGDKATGDVIFSIPDPTGGIVQGTGGGSSPQNLQENAKRFIVNGDSSLGAEIYMKIKAASDAHPDRTLTLKDIDDPCIGADQPQRTSSSTIPEDDDDAIKKALTAEYTIDQTYQIGADNISLPPAIQKSLNQKLDFCEDIPRAVHDTGAEMAAQIYSCKRAMSKAFASSGLNGVTQDGSSGFEGTTRVWFGSNLPTGDEIFAANQAAAEKAARDAVLQKDPDATLEADAAAAEAAKNNAYSYSMDPNYTPVAKPNGEIHISGHFKYSFIPLSTTTVDKDLANKDTIHNTTKAIGEGLRTSINQFIGDYVTAKPREISSDQRLGTDDSFYADLCKEDGADSKNPAYCSLTVLGSELIDAAQAQTAKDLKDLCEKTPTDPRCAVGKTLDSYTINSIPEYTTDKDYDYVDANGEEQQGEWPMAMVPDPSNPDAEIPLKDSANKQLYIKQVKIVVPLKKSWWNAGASYLIIDNQFAANIKVLIEALRRNAANLVFSQKSEGSAKVNFNVMVEQKMPKALDVTSGWAHCYGVRKTSVCTAPDHKDSSQYDTLLYTPQDISIDLPNLRPDDFQSSGANYYELIAPYNPNIEPPDNPNQKDAMYNFRVSNTSDALYAKLAQVPAELQDPLVRILMVAKAESLNNNKNCPIGASGARNCFQNLTPYLSNMVNVMQANHIIANTASSLPLNAAMDQMLNKLMGPGQTTGNFAGSQVTDNSDLGRTTAENMSSIMNRIYNFGYTDPSISDNVTAEDFSMIQNIRITGISILVACISSMQNVLYHFQQSANNLMNSVNSIVNSGDGATAKNLAEASFGTYTAAAGVGTVGAIAAASAGIGLSSAGATVMGTGNPGLAGVGVLVAKIGELTATGLGLTGQALSVAAQSYQAKAELAIATQTITTMSQLGIQLMWLPLFLFVMTSLITVGIQFAFVIPFMPYIMFWGGQIAWVLGVIEALVAAPLVMLAFAHPGGNDYMGHAQPAVRFLLGVTFRPVLMVIGMLTGILLTYVLIHYSAEGFHIVASNTLNTLDTSNVILSGAISCFLVLMYASFLMMAFTKCFSPIYLLPEKVVQWINGQQSISGGEQEAQQFGQQAQQTSQSGAQASGQTMSQGIDAQKQSAQGHSDTAKQGMATDVGNYTKQGEAAGKASGDMVKFSRTARGVKD